MPLERASALHVIGYGDSKSPTMTFPGASEPAAQPSVAGCVRDVPPLTEA